LAKAIEQHQKEGGIEKRRARFYRYWRRLVDGMRERGFCTLIPDEIAAPIVTTFLDPVDPNYNFPAFGAAVKKRGFIIFPGRLTAADTFRIGCMGWISDGDIDGVIDAIMDALKELGVKDVVAPADTAPARL
jgi:2-aminoethylphosphonate-pyruvate transaminase